MAALIVGYGVAVAAASCWVARGLRGPEDFLLGRGGLGVGQGIGLFGGIFLGATAVGVVGQGYQRGLAGAALDLALGLGFGILGLTLLKRVRTSGHTSLAGLLRTYYGPFAGGIGALVVGGAWLVLLAAFVAAAGISLEQLSGWSPTVCTVVTVAILLLYAMPGGMRAVTLTNLAHLAVLAFLLVAVAVLAHGHEAARIPPHQGSFSWGYLVGVLLLSTPTTVVAPDVMMGIAALRTLSAARWALALVVLLLTCGGVLLTLLGARAAHLLEVADTDHVLPRLIDLLLPSALAPAGLLVLFGAALTGAVAEVMVCTFILNEQITAWRRSDDGPGLSLISIRLQMVGIGTLAGIVALADPHVVGLVLTAFRVFVPGIVPQAILAVLGWRTRSRAVVASMIAGPSVCLLVALVMPGLDETPADPVLWGAFVAMGTLAAGHLPRAPSGLHEQ